jgi:hypothetical protein
LVISRLRMSDESVPAPPPSSFFPLPLSSFLPPLPCLQGYRVLFKVLVGRTLFEDVC